MDRYSMATLGVTLSLVLLFRGSEGPAGALGVSACAKQAVELRGPLGNFICFSLILSSSRPTLTAFPQGWSTS